jgi:hypothetical protein
LPGIKTRTKMDYKYFFRQIALIIVSPSKAAEAINAEGNSLQKTRNNILLPMLLLILIFAFLGSIFFSNETLKPAYSVFVAARYFVLDLILVYLSALIFREIAKALDLTADYSLSFRITVYTLVPFFICQIVSLLFESLAFVDILALYGLWMLWSAGEIILNVPQHKKIPMLVATAVVIAELYIGGSIALASVFDRIYFAFFA